MRRLLLIGFLLFTSPTYAQPVSFLVFFDWNRATLTNEAHRIIRQAAGIALRTRAPVEVNGFTDASGTVPYNNALSWRRVQVVASELQRNGVPLAALHVQGYGEAFLRLPTPNGIREPQNRRVRITIRTPLPPPPPPVMVPYPYPFFWGFPRYWGYRWY